MPIVGGDASVWDTTLAVNLGGTFNTLRAAGEHISHERGYALAVASLAAAVHLPLLSPYCASKAGVEALAGSLRAELRPSGARVGTAYFAEIDTDMTSRGFAPAAARHLTRGRALGGVAPLAWAVGAVVRGIERRSRVVVAPRWVAAALPARALIQPVLELAARGRVAEAVRIARSEGVELTTPQPR
jgi:NAD(P)-dependent dehydrogenase (short-subunit alcohol dehydrogenase family)